MTALIGLFSGFALIAIAMLLGGTAAAFLNIAGLLLVLFGTMAVTVISFSAGDLLELPSSLKDLIFGRKQEPTEAAYFALQIAEKARRDGVLTLPSAIRKSPNTLLGKAIHMLADGATEEEVDHRLKRESWSAANRHKKTGDILRRAGEVAPAMGLIGTLIGLVQLLGQLSDPAAIGPAMAVAILTTFYGAVLAHMVFLPLAAKADRAQHAEQLVHHVYATAATSIGRNENPRRLESALNALLPMNKQISYF